MIRSRLRQAKRGSSGFNFPGVPFPVDFAYDFLVSPNPIIGGGTTTTVIDADGTFVNSSGLIQQKTANVWPLDYDPVTLQPLGLPVWEARTNLLLNSLLNGTNLSTQSVALSAIPYTLSFYGTGTITLSGASTAGPLVGSGAYPTRSTLTFTPSAGSVTFTVTGTVQYANLEAGSFATHFIPTAGAAVTRAADVASILTAPWLNALEGTLVGEWIKATAVGNTSVAEIHDGTGNNRLAILQSGTSVDFRYVSGGVATSPGLVGGLVNLPNRGVIAYAIGANQAIGAANATLGTATSPAAGLSATTTLNIGSAFNGTSQLNGWLRKLAYSRIRQPNGKLQEAS